MKRCFTILCICVLFVLSLCACNYEVKNDSDGGSIPSTHSVVDEGTESLKEKLIREIDGAYYEEAEKPENNTTIGMVEIAAKYTEKWKQISDEYYDRIMQDDSSELNAHVSDMRTNWEDYYQKQCESYKNTLQIIYEGGSVTGPLFASYKYEMQKEWALQIVEIYEIYQQLCLESN